MADSGSTKPTDNRHALVTDNNHGPVLSIATWFLMVVMILAVILRVAIRMTTAHVNGKDDAICIAAMVSTREPSGSRTYSNRSCRGIVMFNWRGSCNIFGSESWTGNTDEASH
jgi:hypothetical protein